MSQILPALWSTPPNLSDEGVAAFDAIRNALKWASELVRHAGLAQFCEDDFYLYQHRMRDDVTPLWEIVDRKTDPVETWICAWAIREAIRTVSEAIEQLFMDANYPWIDSQKLPSLEFARKRLVQFRNTFSEEPLMRDLYKAVAKEFPLEPGKAARDRRDRKPSTGPAPGQSDMRRRPRGRPSDTDAMADKQMFDAWKTGQYKTFADAAREFDVSKKQFQNAVGRHRKREHRRTNSE